MKPCTAFQTQLKKVTEDRHEYDFRKVLKERGAMVPLELLCLRHLSSVILRQSAWALLCSIALTLSCFHRTWAKSKLSIHVCNLLWTLVMWTHIGLYCMFAAASTLLCRFKPRRRISYS
ncbi:hypothetical protein CgunFtcFv8_018790 [Champsocephalus gunnari]|uniref:Uncharacterized protein n=1 Tax=Champsocephalus gunnari TaxID=52237 RepID=A0AAN8BTK2_CHAGU|nr:hypothetical protein CgunFtcFv8_018790 [Champsocephalus gunnari]